VPYGVSRIHARPAFVARADRGRQRQEALRAARSKRPDIVLLDITLPGLDGFHVASVLRTEPGFDGLKIVAITGHAGDSERQRSREVGIDHYMVKPVDFAFIESLLGRATPAGSG